MRRTMRSDGQRKKPKHQQKSTVLSKGQCSAAVAAAVALAAEGNGLTTVPAGPAPRQKSRGTRNRAGSAQTPTDVSERQTRRRSIVHVDVAKRRDSAVRSARKVTSNVLAAGKNLVKSMTAHEHMVWGGPGAASTLQGGKELENESSKRPQSKGNTYSVPVGRNFSKPQIRARWLAMRDKTRARSSTANNQGREKQSDYSRQLKTGEDQVAKRIATTKIRGKKREVKVQRKQALAMLDGSPERTSYRHDRNDSTVTRFSQFMDHEPRPKMPAIGLHSNSSWRHLRDLGGELGNRIFHPEKKRRGSDDSDLSFADAGVPAQMMRCARCGEMPGESQMVRYGLCRRCAERPPKHVYFEDTHNDDEWPERTDLNLNARYTMPGNPFGETWSGSDAASSSSRVKEPVQSHSTTRTATPVPLARTKSTKAIEMAVLVREKLRSTTPRTEPERKRGSVIFAVHDDPLGKLARGEVSQQYANWI